MSRPAVTIVVPTFNRAEWLRGAIDSGLAQDYEQLELLVVDDGSTDGTAELLSEYEQRCHGDRFRVVSQANAGQAVAINRGWDLARGELVGYLADDDLLAPGAVSRLVEELVADPGCAVVYPGYHLIEADGAVIDTIRPIDYSPQEAVRLHDTIIGPGALIRREALGVAGTWDPELRWIGDLILWVRLGVRGRLKRVAEPLASWRRHPQGATSQVSFEHAREHVRVAELGIELLRPGRRRRSGASRGAPKRVHPRLVLRWRLDHGPGNRWATVDLQRPAISAYAAAMPWNEMPDERADEPTRLWRELALATTELAALRAPRAPRPGGLGGGARASRPRRRPGRRGRDPNPAFEAGGVRAAMLDAAWHCSADSGIGRHPIPARRRGRRHGDAAGVRRAVRAGDLPADGRSRRARAADRGDRAAARPLASIGRQTDESSGWTVFRHEAPLPSTRSSGSVMPRSDRNASTVRSHPGVPWSSMTTKAPSASRV